MKRILAIVMLAALTGSARAESPEAYYLRVTQQNREAMKAAYARHDAVKARMGDRTVRGTRTENSAIAKTRFGGGVGYGGFGGEGGYAGYSNPYVGASNNGFNYGFGFTTPGNASQVSERDTSATYEKVWYDDAWYGGPVEVLNPFCPPENQ